MAIEVHFEKRINNQSVVREPDAGYRGEYLVMTFIAGLFVLGLLFYGWQHYQWIQYGYRIEEAQKKKEQLAETGRQLRLERASLRDPRRIDSIARGELGMMVPLPGQLVTLSTDGPLTIPAGAPPAPPELQARSDR
jgi:cell division protein FtsL